MRKKEYEKPSMKVFDLPRRQQLLTTSAGMMQDYQFNEYDEE